MIPKSLVPLWSTLSDFVSHTCASRDESHGHEHMRQVATTSLTIADDVFGSLTNHNDKLYRITLACAWLHDVPDHKYDTDGHLTQKVEVFLDNHFPQDAQRILQIIERVSYSKEVKARAFNSLDWQDVLGTDGCIIRDIVSDADKLEALGKIGAIRCMQFIEHRHFEKTKTHAPAHIVIEYLKQHAHEKLFRLKDEFIRTNLGKKLAEPLHQELIDTINQMTVVQKQ